MPITRFMRRTFEGQVFRLEESAFIECTLKNCVIYYSGGSFDFEKTNFENCQWKFQNQAGNTMQLLALIGLLRQSQTLPPASPTQTH